MFLQEMQTLHQIALIPIMVTHNKVHLVMLITGMLDGQDASPTCLIVVLQLVLITEIFT
jgi:hypothetical protein